MPDPIVYNVDYSTKPEGFRDNENSFGGTSSPIIVGPSPAGNMGRAFYRGDPQQILRTREVNVAEPKLVEKTKSKEE